MYTTAPRIHPQQVLVTKVVYEENMNESYTTVQRELTLDKFINVIFDFLTNRTKILIWRQAFASLQHGFLRSEKNVVLYILYPYNHSSDLRKLCCKLAKACLQIKILVLFVRNQILHHGNRMRNIHLYKFINSLCWKPLSALILKKIDAPCTSIT